MQVHASRGSYASVGFVELTRPSGPPDAAQRAGASGTIELGEDQQFQVFKEVPHGRPSPQTLG